MAYGENVEKKKLRIKISCKRVEAVPGIKSCEFGEQVSINSEHGCVISVKEKSEMNKPHKFVPPSGNTNLYSDCSKLNSVTMASCKRGFPGIEDSQKEKRRKMDRNKMQQCSKILKLLMSHSHSWLFSQPVDPVKLNIPDYFSVISEPMDLGTIKAKLEKYTYSCVKEFAADVRLTFSNAMLYNPPDNEVHLVAKGLKNTFDSRWKCLEAKWNQECGKAKLGHKPCGRAMDADNSLQNGDMHMRMRKSSFREKAAKAKPAKREKDIRQQSAGNSMGKGTDNVNKVFLGCVNAKPPLQLVASGYVSCGSIRYQCSLRNDRAHASSSDLSSERSHGQDDVGSFRMDCETKSLSASQIIKSDPDSDGATSTLEQEDICSSPHLSTLGRNASFGEDWTPLVDVELSPKKALRAAMLKRRFADIILKAKQKTLHGDKADPVKMQREKLRLERQQQKEKEKIEAQIRAAESASQMLRERERESARLALQKMERTVEIDDNLDSLKDLEMLCGGSLSDHPFYGENGSEEVPRSGGVPFSNLLQRLGLFMKDDYITDEDEDKDAILNGDEEEGEIFS